MSTSTLTLWRDTLVPMGSASVTFLSLLLLLGSTVGYTVPKDFSQHAVVPRATVAGTAVVHEDPSSWETNALGSIQQKLSQPRIETGAKNLILMIGDGMGLSTITAARILKGQQDGLLGEDGQLHMETFPYVGTSKTFCNDVQVADSACSSTAYACGVKGNFHTLGVTAVVDFQNCDESMNKLNHVQSVLAWAQSRGMSTGIVTTTSVTDASPAGNYAHAADRDWENDAKVAELGKDPTTCMDIAQQLITQSPGKDVNVILGGGRLHFLSKSRFDPENPTKPGNRLDGRNLMDEWGNGKTKSKRVTFRNELLNVDIAGTDFLLGLFAEGDLAYNDTREANNDPTLAEMTEVAINILSKNPNGYYLFVEGGNIDSAHHDNNAHRSLVETIEFNKAIQKADDLTPDDETLIVVSADHSHLLTISGTADRGSSIFGFNGEGNTGDGLPATTLSYVGGPGYRRPEYVNGECLRPDQTADDTEAIGYRQMATYYKDSANHAGEDVLIFAKGPFAHLFTGINDQTFIAHAMKHAAEATKGSNSASQMAVSMVGIFITTLLNYFILSKI